MKPILMDHHFPKDPPIKKDQEVRQIQGETKDVYWKLGLNYNIVNRKKYKFAFRIGLSWIKSTRQPIFY